MPTGSAPLKIPRVTTDASEIKTSGRSSRGSGKNNTGSSGYEIVMGTERVARPGAVTRIDPGRIASLLLLLGREGASQAGPRIRRFAGSRVLRKGRVPLP
ncbi:hypothetical protein QYE76_057482 [Lolium multiflorum]|uniref:Uncharacterized protein n=1 Tax=Lolium multiflorum TaxID=4521 RepID=A0AAD8WQQ3_LOLMU|nr:hypothetical protein QYE76_057482 [Lolium multiflorum]